MTKAPPPSREALRERMRVGDERRLDYELGAVAENLSAQIIEKHEGTTAESAALVSGISAMCLALQSAVAAGGRAAYDMELARWRGREFFEEFVRNVDGHMTRMPKPRDIQQSLKSSR